MHHSPRTTAFLNSLIQKVTKFARDHPHEHYIPVGIHDGTPGGLIATIIFTAENRRITSYRSFEITWERRYEPHDFRKVVGRFLNSHGFDDMVRKGDLYVSFGPDEFVADDSTGEIRRIHDGTESNSDFTVRSMRRRYSTPSVSSSSVRGHDVHNTASSHKTIGKIIKKR